MTATAGAPTYVVDVNNRVGTTTVTTNSGTITTTTTSVASMSVNVVAGETYGLRFFGRISSSVAADIVYIRIHPTSTATTEVNISPVYVPTTATAGFGASMYAEYVAATTGTMTFLASLQRNTGTGNIVLRASSSGPAILTCDRIASV